MFLMEYINVYIVHTWLYMYVIYLEKLFKPSLINKVLQYW